MKSKYSKRHHRCKFLSVSGDWSRGSPGDTVCHHCPPLLQVEQADLVCSSEYIRPNTSCQYQCQSDQLYFTGEWSRTCQQDGTWSGGEAQFSCHQRERAQSLLVLGGLYPPLWPDFVSVVDQFTGSQTVNTSVPPLPAGETTQCSPLSLVEESRGLALIGRELHSVATPALLCHKEPARASKALA